MQNAVDDIRMQRYRESQEGRREKHEITVTLAGNRLSITDTGIGMTRDDLANFFWSIGKSGKHTLEAKSAGVVGTFGIGGMANFGVCSRLEVMTKTRSADRAIVSFAERSQLSAKDDCVFYEVGSKGTTSGTTITGTLIDGISLDQIASYLAPIVQFLDVPLRVGERLLTMKSFPKVDREEGASWQVGADQRRRTYGFARFRMAKLKSKWTNFVGKERKRMSPPFSERHKM